MRGFAPQAQADLDDVVSWLLDHGAAPGAAERMLASVLEAAAVLSRRPQLGRRRSELPPDPFRFWSLPRWKLLLVNRPDRAPPTILRVLNAAQDLPPLLADLRDAPDAPAN